VQTLESMPWRLRCADDAGSGARQRGHSRTLRTSGKVTA